MANNVGFSIYCHAFMHTRNNLILIIKVCKLIYEIRLAVQFGFFICNMAVKEL